MKKRAKAKPTEIHGLPLLDGSCPAAAFTTLPLREFREPPIKRRYSVTGDILAFKRCKRQYGFFKRRGYASAQSGQLFFGTVIHETLDRAHMHFRGELDNTPPGSVPSHLELERYFAAADRALRARGIRPMSEASRQKALDYVSRFNCEHGAIVYPRIVDTEHRLEKDKGTYILHGIVDVVASDDPESAAPWADYEIWDYKGSRMPGIEQLRDYEFQMRVYAHLYELRNGRAPKRAILWFLGEDDQSRQTYPVQLDRNLSEAAIRDFENTVEQIEEAIAADKWSDIAKPPEKETCDACDLRWSCSAVRSHYRLRGLR